MKQEKNWIGNRQQTGNRRSKGTYAIAIRLERDCAARIGMLGVFGFPRGTYVYVGSAMNGLDARIARHLRSNKKRFWHIDYLTRHGDVKRVFTSTRSQRLECIWARRLLNQPLARVVAPGFGSSDCGCPTHLVRISRATLRGLKDLLK